MNALKAFDAAARRKGFTAAAQELSVSPGAVSRHVANLEEYFGVDLFDRHHNEIRLTRAGEQFFSRIRSALDVIENASQRMVEGSNPRQVHITALPTFAMYWLIPRLPHFSALFPRVEVSLSTEVAHIEEIDLDLNGLDIALHVSIADLSSEHCDFLFETDLQLVCNPILAAGPPSISTPGDATNWPLLYTVNRLTQWRQWLETAGVDTSIPLRGVNFGNSSLVMKAALDGVGVALGESEFVRDDLEAGRLVSPVEHRFPTGHKYFMTVNPPRAEMPGVRAFREWLLSEAQVAGKSPATGS